MTSEPSADLSEFVGNHFIYTYANGWQYEWYARSETECDYRIHQGLVGGRWVTHQAIDAVALGEHRYKVDGHEPTGTCVSLYFDVGNRQLHGTIFFPQWIAGENQHPEKTICYQNDFLDDMKTLRDAGPAYPYVIIAEFATITFMEQRGRDNDDVICQAPGQLPPRVRRPHHLSPPQRRRRRRMKPRGVPRRATAKHKRETSRMSPTRHPAQTEGNPTV